MVQHATSDAPCVVRVAQIVVLGEQSVIRVTQNAASEARSLVKVE